VWETRSSGLYARVCVWCGGGVITDNERLIFYWVCVLGSVTNRKAFKSNGVYNVCIICKFVMAPFHCWQTEVRFHTRATELIAYLYVICFVLTFVKIVTKKTNSLYRVFHDFRA